jgi:FkbM family methyltransferase
MWIFKNLIKHISIPEALQIYQKRKSRLKWTANDQKMLDFYSMFVPRGALCFDIGANIGNRVKIFLKRRARVVAVEPQEACVKILRDMYGRNRNLSIIQKALGESEGEAEILVSNANTISSLNPEWIEVVKSSGRFSNYRWDHKQMVKVTTLDKLIEYYGIPTFIKIDVEGFEYEVIRGLSRPIRAISLEFIPEYINSTFNCIDHLQHIGKISLNYSIGETMELALGKWVTPNEMVRILSDFNGDNHLFGDIYVQFN